MHPLPASSLYPSAPAPPAPPRRRHHSLTKRAGVGDSREQHAGARQRREPVPAGGRFPIVRSLPRTNLTGGPA
ncbi:MAG: hypothetical protein ACKOJF_08235, partial [Planctomycetaceae bacterium]